MFHWLSYDIVRFKIEVGVEQKCTKMHNCRFFQLGLLPLFVCIICIRIHHIFIVQMCACHVFIKGYLT